MGAASGDRDYETAQDSGVNAGQADGRSDEVEAIGLSLGAWIVWTAAKRAAGESRPPVRVQCVESAASLNRILQRSGMGKSSLYYYFDDKSDLFRFGGTFYGLRSDPRQSAALGQIFESVRLWIRHALERGQKLGVIRSDLPGSLLVDVTTGLFESLDRWGVIHWNDLTDDERQAVPASHIGLFRDLLSPR